MSEIQNALARAVAPEPEMYGFPRSSGRPAVKVHRLGIPGLVGVLAFAGGALVAMAAVIAISC